MKKSPINHAIFLSRFKLAQVRVVALASVHDTHCKWPILEGCEYLFTPSQWRRMAREWARRQILARNERRKSTTGRANRRAGRASPTSVPSCFGFCYFSIPCPNCPWSHSTPHLSDSESLVRLCCFARCQLSPAASFRVNLLSQISFSVPC